MGSDGSGFLSAGESPFFPGQEGPDPGGGQGGRGQADEGVLKGVEGRAEHGGLRVGVVPALIGAAEQEQDGENQNDGSAEGQQRPVEGGAFPLFLPGQEEVQGFQLFGQGLDVACFRGGNCLSEKGADGCLQGIGKGKQKVGVGDGEPRFP